jgi:hypothetical protein
VGTAPQHEEWTRKFLPSGSNHQGHGPSGAAFSEGEASGKQHPAQCWVPQILPPRWLVTAFGIRSCVLRPASCV